MTNETTTSYINNRKNLFSGQIQNWKSRKTSGFMRLIERVLIGCNISDRLGGNGTQIAHLGEISVQIVSIESVLLGSSINSYHLSQIELSNVLVDVNSGLIKLDNGYVLDDYLPHWQNLIYSGGLGSEYKRLKADSPEIKGLWTAVSDTPYFYHFIVEDLARLIAIIKKFPTIKVAIKSDSQPWKFELLNYFKIPFEKFTSSPNRFERYVTRSGGDHKNLDGLQRMNAEVLRRKEPTPKTSKKIVITRRGLARENAEDLQIVSYLNKFGFVEIQPEKLSISEQIDIFSEASVVVGIHGGSLTNILWCNSDTTVYEIFGHAYRTSDFERLANDMNLKYEALRGTWAETINKLELVFSE